MKSLINILPLFCLLASQYQNFPEASSVIENKKIFKSGNFEYSIDYGEKNIKVLGENYFNITILPPEDKTAERLVGVGARIRTAQKYSAGEFCADISAFPKHFQGPVFAFYLGEENMPEGEARLSKEWHEIDFELLGKCPNEYWTNYFNETQPVNILMGRGKLMGLNDIPPGNDKPRSITDYHRYCMRWSKDGGAIWTIKASNADEATVVRAENIGKPWKELHGYISIWAEGVPGLDEWSGDINQFTIPTYSLIKNIEFKEL